MSDNKRRASNALPLKRADSVRNVKLECEQLREKLQKSVIDNPKTAKKAALLISMWIEGKEQRRRKAG